jgi:hypothetical protein
MSRRRSPGCGTGVTEFGPQRMVILQVDLVRLQLEAFGRHVAGERIAGHVRALLFAEVVPQVAPHGRRLDGESDHQHPKLGIRRPPTSANSCAKSPAQVVLRRRASDSPWYAISHRASFASVRFRRSREGDDQDEK